MPTAFPAIQNAATRPLFGAGVPTMPQMRDTLLDWFKTLTFVRVVKLQVNFQIEEKMLPITLSGVWEPLSGRTLEIKPEGQRSWNWQRLVTNSDVMLNTDDEIVADSVRYRIMQKNQWDSNGIVEYHLVQDYQGRGTA